jgi:hypothetical protein
MGGGHGWTLSSIGGGHEGSPERKGRGQVQGARLWRWGREGGAPGATARGARGLLLSSVRAALLEEERGKRREKRNEEGKGEKEKWEKILEKIKDNLWGWSQIIFVKERYMSNYK